MQHSNTQLTSYPGNIYDFLYLETIKPELLKKKKTKNKKNNKKKKIKKHMTELILYISGKSKSIPKS